MNDLDAASELDVLKAEHRRLDERLRALCAEPIGDQLQVARLKRQKLMLKDRIERLIDNGVPDLTA
ncbi:MAG: YdcH family protein [Sphingomicrobium sp.]